MVATNPYEVLGVAPGAPEVVIRRAYRSLALQHHPDKDESEDATAKFQQLQEAYERLISPQGKRRAADDDDNFEEDVEDCTDLMNACKANDVQEVERLISQGADVNVQNSVGFTALHYAVGAGSEVLPASGTKAIPVLRMLFEAQCLPDLQSRDGFTALAFAAANGYVPIVSSLLKRQADPDAGVDKAPSAMSLAAESGHKEIVRMLLQNGADPDAAGADKVTALGAAVKAGHSHVAASLLWAKANPNMMGYDQKSPLLVAVENFKKGVPDMLLMVELLLNRKADAGGIPTDYRTPMNIAAQTNSFKMADLLIGKLKEEASGRYWDTPDTPNRSESLVKHLLLPFQCNWKTECYNCLCGWTASRSNRRAKYLEKKAAREAAKAAIGEGPADAEQYAGA